jgi:spermidine synthase
MAKQNESNFAWLAASTILVGAFLLFQVQPVISKIILPWFGGGPSVWTTCLLFFQSMLVLGYAYAHLLSKLVPLKRQAWIHGVLVVLSLLMLPILPTDAWKPTDAGQPTLRILFLLLYCVGAPYLLLSATGPLIQSWFAARYPGRSPYRLYALSNIGSLGALLTYPFLVEPAMTSRQQGWGWSGAYVGYGLLAIALAVLLHRFLRAGSSDEAAGDSAAADSDQGIESRWAWVAWLLLPALASVMLLAVTNYLCQDVAVIPFFWIAPLSVYLLTFIICFDRPGWYRTRLYAPLAAVAMLLVSLVYMPTAVDTVFGMLGLQTEFEALAKNLVVNTLIHLGMLFVACMFCHGELVKCKPPAKQLTSFYLMISVGGAIGGLLVSIVCPLVFTDYLELNLAVLVVFLVAAALIIKDILEINAVVQICVTVGLGMILGIVVYSHWTTANRTAIVKVRNFYGVLVVREDATSDSENPLRWLVNGHTLHGLQQMGAGKRREPTTYYGRSSGVGIAIDQYRDGRPLRIGAIGLGVGTLACYAEQGDELDFFEINPQVIELANSHFSFLKDCPIEPKLILGDARLSLERMQPRDYDLLVVDAFSSDAIPVHLLTVEAIELYKKHLKPGGVMAIHVSNRHLRLVPVVMTLARNAELEHVLVRSAAEGKVLDNAAWVLLTESENFLNDPVVVFSAEEPTAEDQQKVSLWTDQYTNLLEILRPLE